jgi:tRNA pseudouridine13 synthase
MDDSTDSDLFTVAPRPRDPALPRIRVEREDFEVEELSSLELEGEGHHTYLWVEKRGRNTADVALDLAEAARVALKEVGYAGLKDKHAITRQWFSVLHLDPQAALDLELPGVRVLRAELGQRRLRAGMLDGNRFWLTVRNVAAGQGAAVAERLREIERRGMPNRFGLQRFGGGGRNIALGLAVLQGEGRRRHGRTRKFLVSALQSAVFNEVLRRRPVPPDAVMKGDLVLVHGYDRFELVEDPEAVQGRLERFEISATGPLFGFKARQPGPRVARLEHEVLEDFGLGDLYGMRLPKGLQLYGGRRAVRAKVGHPSASGEGDTLRLHFDLPAGSYATVLLEELFPEGFTEGDRIEEGTS